MMLRTSLQIALWLLSMALVLFLAAGDTSWTAAWGFLAEIAILALAVSLWLARTDPALLAERLAPPWRRGQESWDRGLIAGLLVGFYAWLALMGLDSQRWRLGSMPQSLQGLGVLAIAAAVLITWLTFRANHFASITVKVQPGQIVSETGPYALVRHPMYAGAIGFFIGAPLMLGSWLGLAVAPLFVVAMAARAIGEEQLLRARLPGYDAYAARVRYRFVPRVW